MDISYNCGVDDKGFKDCNKIQILNVSDNPKIKDVNHLRYSLIYLDICGCCGVDDKGFEYCNKIKILNVRNNPKIKNWIIIIYFLNYKCYTNYVKIF